MDVKQALCDKLKLHSLSPTPTPPPSVYNSPRPVRLPPWDQAGAEFYFARSRDILTRAFVPPMHTPRRRASFTVSSSSSDSEEERRRRPRRPASFSMTRRPPRYRSLNVLPWPEQIPAHFTSSTSSSLHWDEFPEFDREFCELSNIPPSPAPQV